MIKSFLKIEDKNDILKKINDIPFTKHKSVIKGVSSFDYRQKDFGQVFTLISNKFLSMVGDNYKIHDFWINKYFTGGYVEEHFHPKGDRDETQTGVYYFQQPEGAGDLIINHKKANMKEGDMIIFDPHEMHWTEKNLSKQEKIIFSVNMIGKT